MFSTKMKTIGLLTLLLLMLSAEASAQSDTLATKSYHRTIYIELGGSAGLYSLNFDYVRENYYALRAGLSHIPQGSFLGRTTIIPISISFLAPLKKRTQFLELGLYATWGHSFEEWNHKTTTGIAYGPLFGLRGQDFIKGKGFFRITATPFWDYVDKRIYFWGGVSMGHSF